MFLKMVISYLSDGDEENKALLQREDWSIPVKLTFMTLSAHETHPLETTAPSLFI